jgi:hypothetical protein
MATRPDRRAVGHAADRLLEAVAGAGSIHFDDDEPIDALASAVRAIGRIYDRASNGRFRRKH